MWIGRILLIFYVLLIGNQLSGKNVNLFRDITLFRKIGNVINETFKTWFMFVAGLVSLATYIYCHHICEKRLFTLSERITFSHRIFSLSLSIGAIFICACVISGYIFKYFPAMKRKLPTGMLSSGLFASLLPTCACGSIPIAQGMLGSGRIPLRSVIVFIMVSPVLNPYLMVFSFQLGWAYALLRILGIFVLAIMTGLLLEKVLMKDDDDFLQDESGDLVCQGCQKQGINITNNVFAMSWDLMVSLLPYFAIGIVIGSLAGEILPRTDITQLFSSDILGLFILVFLSLPLFLCAGQEVILLLPFIYSVIPLGHALAFTFAGTGICLSSIPLMYKVVGKKATVTMILSFFFGSIAFGFLINLVL